MDMSTLRERAHTQKHSKTEMAHDFCDDLQLAFWRPHLTTVIFCSDIALQGPAAPLVSFLPPFDTYSMPVPPPLPPPGANAPSVVSLAGAPQALCPHPHYGYPPPHTKMDVDTGHSSVQSVSADREEEREAAEELRASKRGAKKNRSKKSDGTEEWRPGCETKDKRKSGRGQKRKHSTDENELDTTLDDGRAVQLSKRSRRRRQDEEPSTTSQADSRPPPPSHKQPPAPKKPKAKAKAKPKAKPKKKPAKKEKERAAPTQREDAGMMDFDPTRFFFYNSRRERVDDTAHHAHWSAPFGVDSDSDSDSEPDELEHQHKEEAPGGSSEWGHEVERPSNTAWTEAEVCRDAEDGMIDSSDSSLILSTMGGMGFGMGCGLPGYEDGDNDLPPTWWEQGIGIAMPEELPGDSEAIWPDPLFMDE
ncbi:unnamed protein product [Vitrella brassicaformis CCMP3155]|uniref:Uncharacterized protein n=1 Tax=Vitrella brassicaformis (strain CCMP3155) TaxID=1169540 RepID=A0A0G4F4I4_VITBC|nr:unnamed protein product [Vitrella brassicaformis CCMP3155]|eukprot:CEM06800.1 unnamed protein product [Vitrella brassicaformis CCMP3155]